MTAVKLTALGRFVARHGVQTPAKWWTSLIAEARRVYEREGDWQQLIAERRDGLNELLDEGEFHRVAYPEAYGGRS